MSPLNSHIEALISKVMVFGGWDFGRSLGLDEVMMVGPHDGIIRRGRKTRALSPSLSLPCEDTARGGYLQARKRALSGTKSPGTLILYF